MSFLWPGLLLTAALIPLGALVYLAIARRRQRLIAGRSGRFLTASATGRAGVRRQIPALCFVAGFAVLSIALARPQASVALPSEEGTVILAFDVSGSMAADDVAPTRMEAAKAATQAFVENQPAGVVIGVVAFSDSGLSVQAATNDQAAVLAAINRMTPERGTSLAQGIAAALAAISVAEDGPNVDYYSNRSPEPSATPAPVPAGSDTSAIIVLLTDGENNEEPDPALAAQAAADRGVRVFTVGIGSQAGTTLDVEGFRVHTQLNEDALRQIAEITGGTYTHADDQQDLRSVYDDLDTRLVIKPQQIEVTAIFAGAGLMMLVAGALGSLLWLGRMP